MVPVCVLTCREVVVVMGVDGVPGVVGSDVEVEVDGRVWCVWSGVTVLVLDSVKCDCGGGGGCGCGGSIVGGGVGGGWRTRFHWRTWFRSA